MRRHDCHVVGGSNGQQHPDVYAKGVNDGSMIAVWYFGDSAVDSRMAAMSNGGAMEG